jgi:hypothetical protein
MTEGVHSKPASFLSLMTRSSYHSPMWCLCSRQGRPIILPIILPRVPPPVEGGVCAQGSDVVWPTATPVSESYPVSDCVPCQWMEAPRCTTFAGM